MTVSDDSTKYLKGKIKSDKYQYPVIPCSSPNTVLGPDVVSEQAVVLAFDYILYGYGTKHGRIYLPVCFPHPRSLELRGILATVFYVIPACITK